MHQLQLSCPLFVLLPTRTIKLIKTFTINRSPLNLLFASAFSFALISVSVSTPVAYANTGNEAMDLLNRMHHALHKLNYKGTLVYRQDDLLSTLHIDHSVVNGVERERVVRLNEQGSEVSRELKGFSLASIPVIRPHMEKVYSFDLGRENRVANIPCTIITARPKDRVRYLQKYCIDLNSGLLLDYMLVGKSHKPVEQFMFTSIEIGMSEGQENSISEISGTNKIIESLPLDVELQLNAASPIRLNKSVTPVLEGAVKSKSISIAPQVKPVRQISSSELDDGWVMEPLPTGFEITQAPSMKHSPDADAVTKHYVVSDGLSSLSVFVSPLSASIKKPKHAIQVNSGALNMIAKEKNNHLITVVGEVPESTLKSVVKSLRKKDSSKQ